MANDCVAIALKNSVKHVVHLTFHSKSGFVVYNKAQFVTVALKYDFVQNAFSQPGCCADKADTNTRRGEAYFQRSSTKYGSDSGSTYWIPNKCGVTPPSSDLLSMFISYLPQLINNISFQSLPDQSSFADYNQV